MNMLAHYCIYLLECSGSDSINGIYMARIIVVAGYLTTPCDVGQCYYPCFMGGELNPERLSDLPNRKSVVGQGIELGCLASTLTTGPFFLPLIFLEFDSDATPLTLMEPLLNYTGTNGRSDPIPVGSGMSLCVSCRTLLRHK